MTLREEQSSGLGDRLRAYARKLQSIDISPPFSSPLPSRGLPRSKLYIPRSLAESAGVAASERLKQPDSPSIGDRTQRRRHEDQLLDQLSSHQTSRLVITGEAGQGKSLLLETIARRMADALVLNPEPSAGPQCVPLLVQLSYWHDLPGDSQERKSELTPFNHNAIRWLICNAERPDRSFRGMDQCLLPSDIESLLESQRLQYRPTPLGGRVGSAAVEWRVGRC